MISDSEPKIGLRLFALASAARRERIEQARYLWAFFREAFDRHKKAEPDELRLGLYMAIADSIITAVVIGAHSAQYDLLKREVEPWNDRRIHKELLNILVDCETVCRMLFRDGFRVAYGVNVEHCYMTRMERGGVFSIKAEATRIRFEIALSEGPFSITDGSGFQAPPAPST